MPDDLKFPIARSILAADALAKLVEYAYGLHVEQCQLIKAMILDTYRLTTSNGLFILRVYPFARRSLPQITAELEFLRYLAANGLAVSVPVEQRGGETLLTIAVPEGVRYAALFTYAPGKSLSDHPDSAFIRAYGRAIAQVHQIGDTLSHPLDRAPLNLDMLLERPLKNLAHVFPHRSDDWSFLRQLGDRITPVINALAVDAPGYGLLHGDVGAANVHVSDDGTLTLFDFDFCGTGWRAYDIGTFLLDEPGELGQTFLAGYEDIRPIPEAERATIPYFQILQSLWVLGIRADYVNEWGNMYFPDRFVNRVMNAIRETAEQIKG